MSYIAFHTSERTGYISGREAAGLWLRLNDSAAAARRAAFSRTAPPGVTPWPPVTSREEGPLPERTLYGTVYRHYGHVCALLPDGPCAERLLDVDLNSAIRRATSPSEILALRIAAQCEVHLFVEPEHRSWFAGELRTATAAGVLDEARSRYPLKAAEPHGWAQVADLVDEPDGGPVVLSYSVTAWFPNKEITFRPEGPPRWATEEHVNEVWGNTPDEQKWDEAVAGLRRKANTSHLLRLTPTTLDRAEFGTTESLTWAEIANRWILHAAAEPVTR